MSILLLLSLTEKVAIGLCKEGNGVLSSLGNLARFMYGRLGKMWATSRHFSLFKLICKTRCGRLGKLWATPLLFTLFLALSLLLVVAGDVETNPGPISGEGKYCSYYILVYSLASQTVQYMMLLAIGTAEQKGFGLQE